MKAVQKFLTVEHFVDAVMIVFALASVGNVREYMSAHGHNAVTAYGVGVALGFGLVAASVLLARLSPGDGKPFWFMLVATVTFGLLSGTVQSFAYLEHRPGDPLAAYLQGFGFPLIGECLLAVAMSVYTDAQRQKRLNASDDQLNERINGFVNESLDSVDLSKMTKYIEQQVGLIVRSRIDNIVQQRLRQASADNLVVQRPTPVVQPNVNSDSPIVQPKPLHNVQNDQIGHSDDQIEQTDNGDADSLDKANEQRQDDVVQRQQRLLNILSEQMSAGVSDLHKLMGGDDICTRSTLYNDLQALSAQGLVYNADRKWHYGSPVQVTNGHR